MVEDKSEVAENVAAEEIKTEESTEDKDDIKPAEVEENTSSIDNTEAKPTDPIENMETADATENMKTEDTTATEDVKTENATEDTSTEEDIKSENVKEEIKPDGNGCESEDSKPSLLQMKIIRQVEYYFGNVNLWRDKFLKEKRQEDDGWVTIECLTTFNRLQNLSMDFEEIASALAKSKTGLLEIHEDKTKIRRSLTNPLPNPDDPMLRKASKMKTLYMKGFPSSYKLDDVEDFVLSHQCQNIFIKMRKDDNKTFKGSIIIELATLEEADKLLNSEIKLGHEVLTVMRRDEYFDKKNEKRRCGKKNSDDNGHEKSYTKEDDQSEPPRLGCVMHFKGTIDDTSREDLKELFGEHEPIEWVDFNRGDTQGYVRFKNEGGAKKAIDAVKAANDDKIAIKEVECEVRILEGIEEKNYWILANEDKKRSRFQSNRGGHRGGHRGGNRGRKNRKDRNEEVWRKRRRPWEESEKPRNEHKKFDDEGNGTETNKGENIETEVKKAKVET